MIKSFKTYSSCNASVGFILAANIPGYIAQAVTIKYINKIETYLNIHDFRITLTKKYDQSAQRLIGFLNKYLITWNDYKKRYLTPRTDRFYLFSRFLEKIKSAQTITRKRLNARKGPPPAIYLGASPIIAEGYETYQDCNYIHNKGKY